MISFIYLRSREKRDQEKDSQIEIVRMLVHPQPRAKAGLGAETQLSSSLPQSRWHLTAGTSTATSQVGTAGLRTQNWVWNPSSRHRGQVCPKPHLNH